MKVNIEITEKELKAMVYDRIDDLLGELNFEPDQVKIEVKSKQNYNSEWEMASFRARIVVDH